MVTVGAICFFYNKSIANKVGKIYWAPIKWIFGEKPWVVKLQHYFIIWGRIALYAVTFVSLVIAALVIAGIYDLI